MAFPKVTLLVFYSSIDLGAKTKIELGSETPPKLNKKPKKKKIYIS